MTIQFSVFKIIVFIVVNSKMKNLLMKHMTTILHVKKTHATQKTWKNLFGKKSYLFIIRKKLSTHYLLYVSRVWNMLYILIFQPHKS